MFALRMAFLECEVFFFGTASRNGGNSSKSDCSEVGSIQLDGLGADRKVGRNVAAANIVLHAGNLAVPNNDRETGRARAVIVVCF